MGLFFSSAGNYMSYTYLNPYTQQSVWVQGNNTPSNGATPIPTVYAAEPANSQPQDLSYYLMMNQNKPTSSGTTSSWTPTPVPTQTSQPQSSGITTDAQAIAAGYTGMNDYRDQMSRQSSNNGGNLNLDSVYNPLFDQLGQYENQARTDYQSQQDLLKQEEQNNLDALATNKQQTNENIVSQQKTLDEQKQSALSQAIRDFNALNQRGMAQFGQGSSAGGAMNAISREEYFRQQGNMNKTYAGEFDKIRQYQNQVDSFFINEDKDLRLKTSQALQTAQSNFNNNMNQINSQRATLQSQKSQQIVAAKQQYQAALDKISVDRQNQAYALEIYKQQLDMQVQAQLKGLSSQAYTTPDNTFANDVINPFVTTDNSSNLQTMLPTKKTTKNLDEWSQLDPFNSASTYNSYA